MTEICIWSDLYLIHKDSCESFVLVYSPGAPEQWLELFLKLLESLKSPHLSSLLISPASWAKHLTARSP